MYNEYTLNNNVILVNNNNVGRICEGDPEMKLRFSYCGNARVGGWLRNCAVLTRAYFCI